MNLYRNILGRLYGWEVKSICLVVCYPTQETYDKIDLPLMDYEIQLMLDYRKLQLQKEGYLPKDPTMTEDEWELIRI